MATPSYDAIRNAMGGTLDGDTINKLITEQTTTAAAARASLYAGLPTGATRGVATGGPVKADRDYFVGSNPCGEIHITNTVVSPGEICRSTIATDKITLSDSGLATRANSMSYSKYKQDTNQDHEKITWTIEVPGVPLEDIEVYTVDPTDESASARRLFVKVRDTELDRFLNAGEKIATTTLELGVLTIVIDRPFKRQVIEVK